MMLGNDIFEDIIEKLEYCQYISDLRPMIDANQTSEIIKVVQEIPADNYTLGQWNELYNYLLRKNEKMDSIHEIKQLLIDDLKK